MNNLQVLCKRLFDITGAALGLLAFSPAMLLIMVVHKLSSRGPIFYIQPRIGRGSRIINVIKFRTMVEDGEQYGTITTASDARITTAGRWLRRLKLDEFPQLWNVFVGDMSFVGPRPDVSGYADRLIGQARDILSLRPGITGPASLYFKNEEELLDGADDPKKFNDQMIYPAKVAINLTYLEQWSLLRDIGYIIITLIPVFDRYLKLVPNNNIDLLVHQGIDACGE
jgi:lipopolysaccharide/colanic/teichoic acid biosynthesis glycosyltransferase